MKTIISYESTTGFARKVILTVLLVLVLAAGVLIVTAVKDSAEKMNAIVNADIDMAQVADGIYTGSSDSGLVEVEVLVEVRNHQITSIDLVHHQNGKGASAEAILEEMIAQNTDNVDAVSGATMSSKTIRGAVNAALQKGLTICLP